MVAVRGDGNRPVRTVPIMIFVRVNAHLGRQHAAVVRFGATRRVLSDRLKLEETGSERWRFGKLRSGLQTL